MASEVLGPCNDAVTAFVQMHKWAPSHAPFPCMKCFYNTLVLLAVRLPSGQDLDVILLPLARSIQCLGSVGSCVLKIHTS